MLHGISHSNRRTRRRYEALERVSFSVGILPTVLDSTMSNGTPGKPPYLSGVEVSESSVLPAQFSRVQISAQLCAIAEGALSPGALLSDKVKPRSPRHRFLGAPPWGATFLLEVKSVEAVPVISRPPRLNVKSSNAHCMKTKNRFRKVTRFWRTAKVSCPEIFSATQRLGLLLQFLSNSSAFPKARAELCSRH
jgi:hypothetical protein